MVQLHTLRLLRKHVGHISLDLMEHSILRCDISAGASGSSSGGVRRKALGGVAAEGVVLSLSAQSARPVRDAGYALLMAVLRTHPLLRLHPAVAVGDEVAAAEAAWLLSRRRCWIG